MIEACKGGTDESEVAELRHELSAAKVALAEHALAEEEAQHRVRVAQRGSVARQKELEGEGLVELLCSFTKPSVDAPVGVVIAREGDGKPTVQTLRARGLAEASGLQVGDIIVSVNEQPTVSETDAVSLLKAAEGTVAIGARRHIGNPTSVSFAIATRGRGAYR